jgi:hypothetical protein
MISDLTQREDELGGKTLLIIGLGRIGGRLAQLAKAFDMRVVGFRRDPAAGAGAADSVHALGALPAFLPRADFVALTCPLTEETRGVIDARALGLLPRGACVVNCGPCRRATRGAPGWRGGGYHRSGASDGGLAVVGAAEFVDHAAHGGGDAEIRGECDRDPTGESRSDLARGSGAAERGRVAAWA